MITSQELSRDRMIFNTLNDIQKLLQQDAINTRMKTNTSNTVKVAQLMLQHVMFRLSYSDLRV